MIAGLYGLNITNKPELPWRWGYPVVMTVMLSACLGLFVGLRRSGWL
jgi:magnesium transporter